MSKKLTSKPSLCVSCRICEMSCSLEKAGMFNPVKARIWIQKNKKDQYAPMICRQCKNASCEKACPVEGEKPLKQDKDTGLVSLSLENCTSCYECVKACAFEAMRIDPHTGQVFKCDLCDGDPECVKWCPTGAIQYNDTKEKDANSSTEKV